MSSPLSTQIALARLEANLFAPPSGWRGYGLALLSVVLAYTATLLLPVRAEHSLSLIFFFAAIAVSAGLGGLGPGLFATLISALACDYFFLPPVHTFWVAAEHFPLMLLFFCVATLLNTLGARLRARQDNLRQLSHRLIHVQESERRAIARELHDEIGQSLTGLKLSLEMSARKQPEIADTLQDALKIVNELMTHARELSLDLRPAMLDDFGLLATLHWHFERYTRTTGLPVRFDQNGLEARFPGDVETTAYRIVQEALTNVARHARAEEVFVHFWTAPGLLFLEVRDTGCGFERKAGSAGRNTGGLESMEERANLLGGRLTITSAPESGTCVTAGLPLPAESKGQGGVGK